MERLCILLSIPQSSPTKVHFQNTLLKARSQHCREEGLKLSPSILQKHEGTLFQRLTGIQFKSSLTTIPASMAINAIISYMKIKLESCRTAKFCQNTSNSSFILNQKLATGGELLQKSHMQVLVMCMCR